MDVNLPGAQWEGQEVSGADISRILKTKPEAHTPPIILVTAYAMVSERQTLLEASKADDLCAKPKFKVSILQKHLGYYGN